MEKVRFGRWLPFLLAIAFEGSLGLLAWGLGWVVGVSPWERLSWRGTDFAWGVAGTLPLLAVFGLCVRGPWPPLARIRRICSEVIRPFFRDSSVLELALVSLVAGIAEEMLFRGVIQEALSLWLGVWAGIAITSVLFGMVHLITVTYGVLVTLVGIYLGWSFEVSGNLLVVIVAHALYDFIALTYLVRGADLT